MFEHEDSRTIATPGGINVPVSLRIGNDFAGLGRFDSSQVDAIVAQMVAGIPAIRDDATYTLAFARALEHVFAKVLEVPFPALKATQLFALNTEPPPGSRSYTYRVTQGVGVAKVIDPHAKDFPRVGLNATEWQAPIVTTGCSWDFNVMDVARAALTNVDYESRLARAARFAIEFLGEQIAAVGVPSMGVVGVTNAPGVAATTQVSTGTWKAQILAIGAATPSAPAAAVAAVQGIISDVNAMKRKISQGTKRIYQATDLVLPSTLWDLLDGVPRSPAFTDDTLLDYLAKQTGLNIDWWFPLDAASSTGHGRVLMYAKDPDVVEIVRARQFTQFPPQQSMLNYVVPCIAEEGGGSVHIPGGVTYLDDMDQ